MDALSYRHELKYTLNWLDAPLLRTRLRRLMRADPHAGSDGTYLISSLYFDTPDNRALQEKLDGVDPRSKWRIRLYNHDFGLIRLEKKSKFGSATTKHSLQISQEQCRRLQQADFTWLMTAGEPLLRELYIEMHYNVLRPRVIVDYTREAFTLPTGDVRVTLDSNLRTGLNSLDLLDRTLPTYAAAPEQPTVLEVKYGYFLPEIIETALQLENRMQSSISKYALCRMFG